MDKDWYGICERRKEKVLYWLHERRKAGTIQYSICETEGLAYVRGGRMVYSLSICI